MGVEGFLYPNEHEIQWSVLIVLYPYITGLVAGAFIVSSLYHVFGVTSLRPVARFSLITALAFGLVAPLPLLAHLGRPERAFEMFWTPHLTSAMAGFGYIWMFYILLVVVEIWLVYRRDIVRYAQTNDGIKGLIYSALALGVFDVSERSLRTDAKLVKVLATIGIPSAALLHGYVGFIFGAIKANPWWSTPLMPFIFLLSAIVSGIALLIVLYAVVSRLRQQALDMTCLNALAGWLFGFLLIALTLEGMEVFSMMYESEESWEILSQLITKKIALTYLGVQMLGGAVVPMFILGVSRLVHWKDEVMVALTVASSSLILVGVFAMRWNVVIGGQLFSKSFRGFTTYLPEVGGREGLLVAAVIMAMPFVLLGVASYLLPPWPRPEVVEVERRPISSLGGTMR